MLHLKDDGVQLDSFDVIRGSDVWSDIAAKEFKYNCDVLEKRKLPDGNPVACSLLHLNTIRRLGY